VVRTALGDVTESLRVSGFEWSECGTEIPKRTVRIGNKVPDTPKDAGKIGDRVGLNDFDEYTGRLICGY
jgi:hypothetical protein